MKEPPQMVAEACARVVPQAPDKGCDACGKLTLKAVLKCPSISLRHNHRGLDQVDWITELISKPPITMVLSEVDSLDSNQHQCSVCNLIHKQLVNIPAGNRIQIYKCEDLEQKVQSLWMYLPESDEPVGKVTLFADEGTYASKHIVYRPVADPRSDKSIQDIKDWITTCNKSHPRCRYSISGAKIKHASPLPTRVIDVGDSSRDTVRLVISNQIAARYVALSHCWGGSSHCRTTKASLKQYKVGLKIIDLPKTLQDAVFLTRKLGLRYLWVDSVCIIQDDEDDWLREAGLMAAVYEGAYLTIAASSSTDGSGGCFVSREPQELVRVPCQEGDEVSGHMYLGIVDEDAAQRMFHGPLNTRAWVLQERLFARRTVHFARDQIYWECDKFLMGQNRSNRRAMLELDIPIRSLLVCMLGDYLGPSRMPHLVKDPPQKPFLRRDYYSWWANTIRYFSKCGLTRSSDKLPALLSLSTELAKLTGDEYHEGHWHDSVGTPLFPFFSSLLWQGENGEYLKKPPEFRAPSWSWAALDGCLDFSDRYHNNLASFFHPKNTDLQLLKVQVYQPIGLPPRKALLLSGVLIRASKMPSPPEVQVKADPKCWPCEKAIHQICNRISDEAGKEIEGAFMFDLEDAQPSKLWLLAAYSRWMDPDHPAPIHYALLVSEVPNQRASGIVFRRVGVGHFEDARMVYDRSRQFVVLI